MAAATQPKAGDFTGQQRLKAQKALAEEQAARKDEIALANAAEIESMQNDVIDVTGSNASVPVVVDPVEVLTAETDEGEYEVIRVAEDVEKATIASHEGLNTYDFKAGHKYKVPVNVAFHLRERGVLYDRA